ncbi:MAG: hypothetical protein PVJ02_06775, partial [Gemmatimonadota bacterium]
MRWQWWVTLLAAPLAACGAETGPEVDARSVEVLPAAELAVGIGDTVSFRAVVLDGRGRAVEDASVIWHVSDP